MKRDLSKAQFEYCATKLGFKKVGFLGYWNLAEPHASTSVSVLNAGSRNRDRLRYLIAMQKREEEKALAFESKK